MRSRCSQQLFAVQYCTHCASAAILGAHLRIPQSLVHSSRAQSFNTVPAAKDPEGRAGIVAHSLSHEAKRRVTPQSHFSILVICKGAEQHVFAPL
eukprot:20066-Heterococcus_DN1.PRE.2